MSRFEFRLERILQLRTQHEKDRAVNLSQARRRAGLAHDHHVRLTGARDRERAGADRHTAPRTAGELQSRNFFLDQLDMRVQHAVREMKTAEASVRTQLADYHDALRDRSVLERLRDRDHAAWRSESARADQKTMDELGMTRHARGRTHAAG